MSYRGDAPSFELRPGMCCRRESTAADELTGYSEFAWSWPAAHGRLSWLSESSRWTSRGPRSAAAAANVATVAATNNAAAIKTANAADVPRHAGRSVDHQPRMSFRGDAPSLTLRPGIVAVDPLSCSTAADELTGGVSWELAGC